MEILQSGGKQVVRSWASILDPKTLDQALMTARCDAMAGPLALMPDAHLGADKPSTLDVHLSHLLRAGLESKVQTISSAEVRVSTSGCKPRLPM